MFYTNTRSPVKDLRRHRYLEAVFGLPDDLPLWALLLLSLGSLGCGVCLVVLGRYGFSLFEEDDAYARLWLVCAIGLVVLGLWVGDRSLLAIGIGQIPVAFYAGSVVGVRTPSRPLQGRRYGFWSQFVSTWGLGAMYGTGGGGPFEYWALDEPESSNLRDWFDPSELAECPKCGHTAVRVSDSGALYCPTCGVVSPSDAQWKPSYCPRCGEIAFPVNEAGALYCPACGGIVRARHVSPTNPQNPRSE
jgi:ribosomal protein L37AE/L43A